jgi:hypothetical protein
MRARSEELQRGHHRRGVYRYIFLTETVTNVVRVVAQCVGLDSSNRARFLRHLCVQPRV